MKKIFPFVSLAAVIIAASANLISVNIGDQTGYAFLNGLKDFDWKNIDYGDGLNYDAHQENGQAKGKILEAIKNASRHSDPVKTDKSDVNKFLDYSTFNTWFQYTDGIKKQAVTGVPLNEGFMPNGNYVSDFGVTSKAQKYITKNSILDWNTTEDRDAKYNRSYTPLRKSSLTAFAYPDSVKNKEMNFNYLGFSTRKHRTYDNSIVGSKTPFEGTNLNWQYISNFINWSGSWFEGPIVPPPADTIDIAHKNGTPIYGNIFLDGGHGLTRDMLRDFIKKDDSGNYYVVDFLYNLALYNGFDGWFLNDEANGGDPNGTALDFYTLIDIVKQFNEKVAKNNKDLKIIYYRAGASLSKENGEYVDQETYGMTKTMPLLPNGKRKPLDITFAFGTTPQESTEFLTETDKNGNKINGEYSKNNLYTIFDASWNNYVFGTYDWRQLGYKVTGSEFDPDIKQNKIIVDNDTWNSISGYMDNGATSFGNKALKLVNNKDKVRDFVFSSQVANLYNDIFFNGLNTNPKISDSGLLMTKNDYDIGSDKHDIESEFIKNDPRINIDKDSIKTNNTDASIKKEIYNWDSHGGRNTGSYGVGNLIQERTVFEDEDGNKPSIKTNFSTGSGIKFVDRFNDGNAAIIEDYPYTNKRLADVLPTYQWDINEITPSEAENLGSVDPLKTDKTGIDKLNGFYDYDDVYAKSNSIALGSSFDGEGKIEDGNWDQNKNYIWNIIGTNISDKNHTFTITYKDNNSADISPILTTTENDKNTYIKVNVVSTSNETNDHWKTIKFNLDETDISETNKLSKIGLLIVPKKDRFKFNLGELSMDYNNAENFIEGNDCVITNLKSEYRVERNNKVNVRFNYEIKPDINFDYFEFYIKDKSGNWYRVGETSAHEYFIKDIDKDKFGSNLNMAIVTFKDDRIVGSDVYEID